ncbi:MAG: type II toxin-antitoxin system RelE/ParE family toxin [Dehalococcoidia bacterium]|nr:type II toxin-antitoxin system RelE/ParE family toxin [Dehalococcoidia bacterium]
MVKIEWTEGATEDLEKLDKSIARRILRRLAWLSKNFQSIVPEPLTGELKGTVKLRIGDWRAVYTVEGKIIVIQFIGHRSEIYKIR